MNLNDPVWNADNNSPVVACAGGVVIYANLVIKSNGQPSTWGRLVVVEHPDGMCSRYGHLRVMNVDLGQPVKKGQQLGLVGGTEYNVPDHLHFDIGKAEKLKGNPTYWPGDDLPTVLQWFVDPNKWIQEHRGDVTDPPTPPTNKVDLLEYIRGDGRIYTVKHANGAQENFQGQSSGNLFWLVKNSQFESFMYDDQFIYRGLDTSAGPAPDYAERPGDLRVYTQFEPGKKWAKWCPRFMSIGETWAGLGHYVQYYYKDVNCTPSAANSGNATNKTTLKARHFNKVWNGVAIADCIELFTGTTSEGMFFGKGWSLVSWGNQEGGASAVWELLPPSTPGLVRETGCFSSL